MTTGDKAFDDRRRSSNPLFNDNKLKLGLFGYNGNGPQFTAAEERFIVNWPRSLKLAGQADALGLEAQVSFSVYRGPIDGDGRHTANREFEPLTWSAGIGASVKHAAVISTLHPALLPPALVAKATSTIDNITGGRAGLNIVAGFSQNAYDQFGAQVEDPNTRYDRCQEFVDLLKRFWCEEDEFDFEGRFYTVRRGVSRPKPIQSFPAIMNAGQSGRGREFAARNADMAFTFLSDDEAAWGPQISAYRNLAHENYRRDLQVWTQGFLVIADTEREAQDYQRSYAEDRADQAWIDGWVKGIAENLPQLRPDQMASMQRNWAAGGGLPMVGTPDTVADILIRVSRAGLNGVLISSLEPEVMLERFGREVLPRLEQAGLRRPNSSIAATSKAAPANI